MENMDSELSLIESKPLKASYKDCPVAFRKSFSNSQCLMPISIGQSVHENEKLKATLELVNRTFQSCTVLVDDTIQRHTMKIFENDKGKSIDDFYIMSHNAGTEWLKRNEKILSSMSIPCKIIRWDNWLYHKDFKSKLILIEDLYISNADYKNAIDLTIIEYILRNVKNGKIFNHEMAAKTCFNYLKEECAVMTLWVDGGYNFEVYPYGRNKAMAATYKYLIEPIYPELLKSVAIRFKKS